MVITASNANSVKFKITQNIRLMCTLQLNDKYDYVSLVGQTNGLEPEQVKGRGLCKVETALEYQTALSCDVINEGERVQHLRSIFKEMDNAWAGHSAKAIPFVPEEVTVQTITEHEESDLYIEQGLVPIGYNVTEAEIVGN